MLLDILGIVIGFAGVMLALSLLVMAIVQIAQRLLTMRVRNLAQAMLELLPKEQAEWVLKAATLKKPDSWFDRLLDYVSGGSQRTWIEPDEVLLHLERYGLHQAACEVIERQFRLLEKTMSRRFAGRIRVVSMVLSFLVAFLLQFSTVSLLRNLIESPEYRQAAIQSAEQIVELADEAQTMLRPYEDVSEEALTELAKRHPNLRETLEEVSGVGKDKESIIDEASLVLSDLPAKDRDEIVAEYDEILDQLRRRDVEAALVVAAESSRYLTALDFTFWSGGWAFYCYNPSRVENWIGVLITAVLLTLGAPFWFSVLKTAVGLRDALKPKNQ